MLFSQQWIQSQGILLFKSFGAAAKEYNSNEMVQTVINKQTRSIKVISHRSRYTCILHNYPI